TNGIGPNIAADDGCFFRTEADIAKAQQRAIKRARLANAGRPLQCTSKILDMVAAHRPGCVWIAESGFLARLVDVRARRVLCTLRGNHGPVTSVCWWWQRRPKQKAPSSGATPDGKNRRVLVATGSWDKSAR